MLSLHGRVITRRTTKGLWLASVAALCISGCASHDAASRNADALKVTAPDPVVKTLPPGDATGPQGPDFTKGRPFATAAAASAAGGGFYVPGCPGHGTYYLQPNGAVVSFFHGTDVVMLAAPPSTGFVAGPIKGNSVVTPRQLTAQGQKAWGYQATPKIVQLRSGRQEGVLEHSVLTWANEGSTMQLASKSQASLASLQALANSCS